MAEQSSQKTIRVRIAPSPTGALHVGTAHTALFNFLFAKRHGGTFVLRIEDTDAARSTKEWEKNILDGLLWLGITWDEGQSANGDAGKGAFGPYRQSERAILYKQYLEKLLAERKAFYCWHSKEELEKQAQEAQAAGVAPKHICEFRDRNTSELSEENKKQSIIRFKNNHGRITFHDEIHGDIDFDATLLGDFSLARDENSPLYNFAVVVDDFTTQISHVIRGADHISNTPRQIMIQEALGFPRPVYAHLPLLLGKDRSKLSKRHASTSVFEYQKEGYLPQALFNFLALLGYTPQEEKEMMTPDELSKDFDLGRVQKSNAIFDIEKLDWLNGVYIRHLPVPELTKLCIPFLQEEGLVPADTLDHARIEKIVALEQGRMRKLTDIGLHARFFFEEPSYEWELLVWENMSHEELKKNIDWARDVIRELNTHMFEDAKSLEQFFLEKIAGDRGAILWPLRVALTGQKASPPPFDVMAILGKEKTLARLQCARNLLEE